MSKIVRFFGAFLIVLGVIVLGYAAYSFVVTAETERELEAKVPGKPDSVALATPNVLPELNEDVPADFTPVVPPTPTRLATVTATSSPGAASLPTELLPTSTPRPTPQTAVTAKGLPRGTGKKATRLVMPRLNLDTGVKEATWVTVIEKGQPVPEWYVPFDAAGHLFNTALPGEGGNMVISGHHNLVSPNKFGLGKFAGLWNLQVGDLVYIFDEASRVFVYRVTQSSYVREAGEPLIVRQQHAAQIMADTGEPRATFITCWNGKDAPLSGNTYRWIVVSKLVGTVNPDQVPAVAN